MKFTARYFFLLLTVGMLGNIAPVQAQFWKKIFKKEEHSSSPSKSHDKPASPKKKEGFRSAKKNMPVYPESEKKEVYRIDVLMPLHLNTLVKEGKPVSNKTPDNVLPFVHFYEGMTIAGDTLAREGLKVELYIHDITDPAHSVKKLVQNPSLLHSDLIIGALQSPEIPPVATFAQKNRINFVSALSPSDAGVVDNPYFILIQPTLKTHVRKLVEYAGQQFKKEPKYLLYLSNTLGEKEAYSLLKDALDEEEVKVVDCSGLLAQPQKLAEIFDSTETNVIFASVLETENAEKLLDALITLADRYCFELLGMPSWKALKGLHASGNYAPLRIAYTTPFHYDLSTSAGQHLLHAYNEHYGIQPSEMVFRGYETLYWMVHLLNYYGPVFNGHVKDISAAPFTRYNIQPAWTGENELLYLENNQLYIMRYHEGNYTVTEP